MKETLKFIAIQLIDIKVADSIKTAYNIYIYIYIYIYSVYSVMLKF